jgi:hypothetical protein
MLESIRLHFYESTLYLETLLAYTIALRRNYRSLIGSPELS